MRLRGNFEILRTIFQSRTLDSNVSASRKGVYLIFKPLINFFKYAYYGGEKDNTYSGNHGVIAVKIIVR